jgi:U4/U6 small nuclear ribonucleoprotein PRP31
MQPDVQPSQPAQQQQLQQQKNQQELDHQLVVQSNRHLAAIAEELGRAHGALALAYKPKFPELEELLPNYVQYKNAVRCIGNEMDMTKVNDELNEILTSNQIITISVSGSTTSGRPLTEEDLQRVDDAANYMEELLQVQQELIDFVEQSMEALAPSICALIGPSTAAKLLGMAGGLAELTKIPACNLQVLGQVKQNSASRAGLSAANTKQHVGILAECDLVRSVPKPLQKKALKVVASKLALAARYDYVNVDTGRPRSAQTGRQLRQEVVEKFEKLQEPDKAPVLKALPK